MAGCRYIGRLGNDTVWWWGIALLVNDMVPFRPYLYTPLTLKFMEV